MKNSSTPRASLGPLSLAALAAIALGAGPVSLAACGDAATTPADAGASAPDAAPSATASTAPTGTSSPDAGPPDAAPPVDAAPPPVAPITAESSQPLAGALNPYGLAWGADGHLYVSGATLVAGDRQLAVWRIDKATNKPDPAFGTNGVATVALPGDETSYDLVALKDGSFVVQAVSDGKVWLTKLTKDAGGAYAFGAPRALVFGWTDADFASWPVAGATPTYASWGLALDASGATEKVVVFAYGPPAKAAAGAQRTDNDRWVARVLASDLSHDPAFNAGKPYAADVDGKALADGARRGMVEADGSIVSAGYTDFGAGAGANVVLLRLKADGTPDTTFGFGSSTPGQTKFNPFQSSGGAAEAYAVARQSSGRYVTTGYGASNFDTATVENDLVTFGVARDNLDPTYGKLGAFAVQSEKDPAAGKGARPYRETGRDLVVLPDDRTVQVGCYDDFASVFVFTKNGALDATFGAGGRLQYTHAAPFYKVALSPDKKRIAAMAATVTDAALLVTLKVGN